MRIKRMEFLRNFNANKNNLNSFKKFLFNFFFGKCNIGNYIDISQIIKSRVLGNYRKF